MFQTIKKFSMNARKKTKNAAGGVQLAPWPQTNSG
jgi:hypothetical protein